MWQDFHQARLSIARLGDILNTNPEQTYSPSQTALPAIRGDISFEHVTFRYRIDGPAVLQDVSFSVPAGQIVGIVGPSGSGKSTLAKLIQRLYVPESGRIMIDGMDISIVDPAWLRRQIGVAPTISYWSCPMATTPWSANVAPRCRAASASASPSPAPSSPIRKS
jgi:subfamily B ATP-binding cassette protein HlyB/CyaB